MAGRPGGARGPSGRGPGAPGLLGLLGLRGLPGAVALAAGLAAVLAAPPAAAQGAVALFEAFPEQALDEPVALGPGGEASLAWTLANLGERRLVVLAQASEPEGWNATVVPETLVLANTTGATGRFMVRLTAPEDAGPGDHVLEVRIAAVTPDGGATQSVEHRVVLRLTHTSLVLGLWANPLPPPLDNAYGVFLLDLAFWGVVAVAILALQGPLVRFLAREGERHTAARIAARLRGPVFLLLVILGLTQSWGALPPGAVVEAGRRLLGGAAVLVVMYLAFRAFQAAILYYAENVASRTTSQLDDVLVPVLEKVGAVVIVLAGVVYFLGSLGVDLSAFIVGGTVVSLVLAFAAQDTLSNFFASLFLLADRPFAPGDEIMMVGAAGLEGTVFRVDEIGLRSTKLYHFRAHQRIIVPNNDLASKPVINLTYPDRLYRVTVNVGVAYDTDLAKAMDIMARAAREHPDVVEDPKPIVARLRNFGESSLDFEVLFFITNARKRNYVASDVRLRIVEEFRRAGVQIPFPQRVVHLEGGGEGGGSGPGNPRGGVRTQARAPGGGAAQPRAGSAPGPAGED